MLEFDVIQSGAVLLLLLVVGELISRHLKAAVPAILASGLVFTALVWAGILPADMAERSGLTALTSIGIMLVIINMGASTNAKELAANWRVVVLAAVSFIGQLALTLCVIGTLFDRNMAVGALPGGMATALIVQEKARSLGYNHIVILSVLLLSAQSLAASPLVAMLLKKEVKRVRAEKSAAGIAQAEAAAAAQPAPAQAGCPAESHFWPLLRLFAVAWLASRIEMLTGISRYVLCLLLGVLFVEIGFLKKHELEHTKSQGFLMLMMMAMVMSGFASATPAMFAEMCVPLLCVLVCEVGSIFLISVLVGPRLGFSRAMSAAIGMNVMIGFPANMMIAEDVIGFLVEDEEERTCLVNQVVTKMIIGGFTSTTFLATIAAGVLVGMMR